MTGPTGVLALGVLGVFLFVPHPGSSQDRQSASCLGINSASSIEIVMSCARQGHATAQTSLGRRYSNGAGVPKDDAEAVRWYRLAAEQGMAVAQLLVGVAYATSQGVPLDNAEAVRWYRLAAEQGNDRAQLRLGTMHILGAGISENFVLAYKWLSLASTQGNARAREGIEMLVEEMTREQIAEAQKLSREWLEQHPPQ